MGAALVTLPAEVPDAIDEIVPPGATVDPGYVAPARTDPALRRRECVVPVRFSA